MSAMESVQVWVQMGQDYWQKGQDEADPRTADWFMVKDPTYMLYALAFYLLFIAIVPQLMKFREAFSLKPVMLVYNFSIASLSLYMSIESLLVGLQQNWLCTPVDHSNSELAMRGCRITHIFFLSKFMEFLDTFFFILRKKNNQVSFLHVYHHVSITVIWFFLATWVPTGGVFFSSMLNSLVHVFMYSYYFLSALGPSVQPYLWWKRYLTRFQIIQFVAISVHNTFNARSSCAFPTYVANSMTIYMISLITLFTNFYLKAYQQSKANKKKAS